MRMASVPSPGLCDRKAPRRTTEVDHLGECSTIDVNDILEDSKTCKIPLDVSNGSDSGQAVAVIGLDHVEVSTRHSQNLTLASSSQNNSFSGGTVSNTGIKVGTRALSKTESHHLRPSAASSPMQTLSPVNGLVKTDSSRSGQQQMPPSVALKPMVVSPSGPHYDTMLHSPRNVCPNASVSSNIDHGFEHCDLGTARNQPLTPIHSKGPPCIQARQAQEQSQGPGAICSRFPVTPTRTTNIPLASIVEHAKRMASPKLDGRESCQLHAPPCKIQVLDVTSSPGVRPGPGGNANLSSRGSHPVAIEEGVPLPGPHCLVDKSAHYTVHHRKKTRFDNCLGVGSGACTANASLRLSQSPVSSQGWELAGGRSMLSNSPSCSIELSSDEFTPSPIERSLPSIERDRNAFPDAGRSFQGSYLSLSSVESSSQVEMCTQTPFDEETSSCMPSNKHGDSDSESVELSSDCECSLPEAMKSQEAKLEAELVDKKDHTKFRVEADNSVQDSKKVPMAKETEPVRKEKGVAEGSELEVNTETHVKTEPPSLAAFANTVADLLHSPVQAEMDSKTTPTSPVQPEVFEDSLMPPPPAPQTRTISDTWKVRVSPQGDKSNWAAVDPSHYSGTPHPGLTGRYVIPQSQPEPRYSRAQHPCSSHWHAHPQPQRVKTASSITGFSSGPLLTSTPVNHFIGNSQTYHCRAGPANTTLNSLSMSSTTAEASPSSQDSALPSTPNNTPIDGKCQPLTPLPSAGQLTAALYQVKENMSDVQMDLGRQAHNLKERARRARIKNACEKLQQLVPGLSLKTDKATVVELAVHYISFMRQLLGPQYDREFLNLYSTY